MYQDPLKHSFELGRFKVGPPIIDIANSAPYIENLRKEFTVYTTEISKLILGKLSDVESPKTVSVTKSSVLCDNPVDWITPPSLGTETELSIIVRVFL